MVLLWGIGAGCNAWRNWLKINQKTLAIETKDVVFLWGIGAFDYWIKRGLIESF